MTTHATLEPIPVDVVPGGEASCRLLLRNGSDVVEAYQFQVVGDPAPWTIVEPAGASLYPGADTAVEIIFRPPRSSLIPAADVPFAIQVLPSERPQDAVTAEGVVRVQPFTETTAEINPRTSKGLRRARHEVAVDNRGNTPISATVAGMDPDGQLAVKARPAAVTVPPGEAAFAGIGVRNRRTLWRGQPRTRPFQVVVSPEGERDIVLDAATVQTPVIPRAAGRVLAALVALLLLAIAGWFLLLKPAVRSAAKDAVQNPAVRAGQPVSPDSGAAAAGGGSGTTASGASASPTTGPATGAPVTPIAEAALGTPTTVRVQATVRAGTTPGNGSYAVQPKTTLIITDLVLQNPQGDTGRIDVLVDNNAILTLALANFRDLDYHFVSPIEVPAGKTVGIRIICQAPGPALVGTSGSQCREWMFVSGIKRVNA